MNINPIQLMKIKDQLTAFDGRHPKLKHFFADMRGRTVPGAVIEFSITDTDGNKIRTNFRVTDEDKEVLDTLMSMF